jgi:hypothetical protein
MGYCAMATILYSVVFNVVATTLVLEHIERAKTEQAVELIILKFFVAWEIFTIFILHEFKMFIHKTLLDHTE